MLAPSAQHVPPLPASLLHSATLPGISTEKWVLPSPPPTTSKVQRPGHGWSLETQPWRHTPVMPTCHREESPWPLCTQPLLVQPRMGKASAVLCSGCGSGRCGKRCLKPVGSIEHGDQLWVLCIRRSSYESSTLQLCLRGACPGCFSLSFPAMSIITGTRHFP